MWEFLNQHQMAVGAVGALVLSAAARALPEPDEKSSKFYIWFHSFAAILLANLDKFQISKPQK